jgi:CMP-N-acetylneuraminic acid synthetase
MKIVALIPARGGSKGIIRKNLQKFGQVSLLAHKINQARESIIHDIWVTSEDNEILSEAKKYGANVIIRPDKLSGDETSTDEVIVHALDVLELENSDILVLLQTTSPLISTNSINACILKLIDNENLASVITVRESHPFMWSPDQNDIWSPKNHDRKKRLRRQELSEEGWETGGCYAIRVKDAKMQGIRYPSPSSVVKINHLESLDIDTIEDLNSINELKK